MARCGQPGRIDQEYECQFLEDGKMQAHHLRNRVVHCNHAPPMRTAGHRPNRARKEKNSKANPNPKKIRVSGMVNDKAGAVFGPMAGGLEGIQIRFCIGLGDGDRQIGSPLNPLPTASLPFCEGRSHVARNQGYLGGVNEQALGLCGGKRERKHALRNRRSRTAKYASDGPLRQRDQGQAAGNE